jgi:hypothetical protein
MWHLRRAMLWQQPDWKCFFRGRSLQQGDAFARPTQAFGIPPAGFHIHHSIARWEGREGGREGGRAGRREGGREGRRERGKPGGRIGCNDPVR